MNRYDQANDKKSGGFLVLSAIAAGVLASAGWFYYSGRTVDAVSVSETRILALPSPTKDARAIDRLSISEALDGVSESDEAIAAAEREAGFELPDLDNSDGLVRQEMEKLSPALGEWLKAGQLVRKYVVIANDFSQGMRLEKHMRFLRMDLPFAVEQDNGGLVIAANSYRRYDRLAAAVDAVDVQAMLDVYKKLRPLVMQVFKEFSYPDEYSPEDVLAKAAAVVLAAPAVDGRVALVKHSVIYRYADERLEALSPIHKQMLRMGPENTRTIQNKLRLLVEGLVNLKE